MAVSPDTLQVLLLKVTFDLKRTVNGLAIDAHLSLLLTCHAKPLSSGSCDSTPSMLCCLWLLTCSDCTQGGHSVEETASGRITRTDERTISKVSTQIRFWRSRIW